MSITHTVPSLSTLSTVAEQSLDRIAGQTVIPQGVAVDILLDLYVVAADVGMKWSIGDRIEELRGREFLLEDELRADLHAVLAIAEVAQIAGGFLAA
jgi:hypothetical protein